MPLIALHALHYLLLTATVLAVLMVFGWRALPESTRLATVGVVGDLRRGSVDGRPTVLLWAAAATLGAATIHGAVCPEHFREGLRFGAFFLVLTAWQITAAVAIAVGPWRAWWRPSALVSLLTVAIWILTRTVGLPFGLADVEEVGLLDVVATGFEVSSIVLCVAAVHIAVRRPGTEASG